MTGAELEQIISGNFMGGLAERREDIERMVGDYNYQMEDPRTFADKIDMKPFAGLYDSWNARAGKPTNLAGSIQSPESNEERASRLSKMQAAIQKEQTGLSADQLKYLRELLRNRTARENNEDKLNTIREMAGLKAAKAGDKDTERATEKLEEKVQKLQKEIGDRVPQIYEGFRKISATLQKIPNLEDIPGAGPSVLLPQFMKSEEGQDIYQSAFGIMKQKLHLDTGAAASDEEVKKALKELGLSADSTPRNLLRGLENLKDVTIRLVKQKEAAYGPDAVKLFRSRQGLGSDDIGVIKFRKDKPKKPTKSVDDMSEAELDAIIQGK
jgi:hypothetical protein